MIRMLASLLIKNKTDMKAPETRRAYGMLCGMVGIILNILLFSGKFFAGTISQSISITADAFNNLSDAGSSLITLLGFRLAGQKPDSEHPFGHGRLEYVSGLVVAILVILMGFELLKASADKILHPQEITCSSLIIAILVASIAVKGYMALYNSRIGKRVDSPAMQATSLDSLSDMAATSMVLISTLVSYLTGLNIDGWSGLVVAVLILFAGYKAAKDTVSPLLGQPPDPEFVRKVESLIMEHPGILGIHDLVVHDYGPGRRMISVHAEVSSKCDILQIHGMIDHIERSLSEELDCEAVIHMDPIETDDKKTNETKEQVQTLIKEMDPAITIHDFRMIRGKDYTNVIFDAVLPYQSEMTEKQFRERVCGEVCRLPLPKPITVVLNVDRAYI